MQAPHTEASKFHDAFAKEEATRTPARNELWSRDSGEGQAREVRGTRPPGEALLRQWFSTPMVKSVVRKASKNTNAIRQAIPFAFASERIQDLGINVTMEVEDSCNENYKNC